MVIRFREFMDESEGWGRVAGREVYQRLLEFVEANPGVIVFRVSMEGSTTGRYLVCIRDAG